MAVVAKQKQKLFSDLNVCEKVRDTINSKGWQEILEPKLQKMIESVTGQKDENGIYVRGLMDSKESENKLEYYLGYKAALMDFNNNVYNHIIAIEKIKDSIKTLSEQEDKEQIDTKPMEDTRYA